MVSTNNSQKLSVLIVGATGVLGSLITKHALAQPNLQVNILVRDPKTNPELVAQVQKAGGKVIVGDVAKPETIQGVTKGIHTVISALSSPTDPSVFVGPQINLVNDAVKNGVQRFVPSDYGVNYTKFTREEVSPFVLAKGKLEFDDYIKKLPIKTLHFWNGVLLELFFHLQAQGLTYWGDADQKYQFTSYEDIAKVTAVAVADPNKTGDVVFIGSELTIPELAAVYSRVRGVDVTAKRLGSLDDVRQQYEEKTKAGDGFGAFLAGFNLILSDPRASFDTTNNKDFPQVKPTSVEEWLRQNPQVKLA